MAPSMMRAWVVERPAPIDDGPLALVERAVPEPLGSELLVAVRACGVCRTDLHLAEGDLAPRRPRCVPGHEVVGVVEAVGPAATRLPVGARVGIPWLASTCGRCRYCADGRENLCRAPSFTGWDRDGGYAPYATVLEDYAYLLPDAFDDVSAAPLLCAGIIGYRALTRARLPVGGALGVFGFGGSAHLAAQVALADGARVHVRTRSPGARALAAALGAASVGDSRDALPEPLDAAILFAPAGDLVPVALRALGPGGTLAVAGIHLSAIPPLDYAAELFEERSLVSVTANTRADGEAFLRRAAAIPLTVRTTSYPLEEAPRALSDLAHDRFEGAAVLVVEPGEGT